MNIYAELKRRARAKRDKALKSIHEHYRATLSQIKRLERAEQKRLSGTGFREPKIQRGRPGTPLKRLGYAAAAERILMEGKPLRAVELIMELKRRGYRPNTDPRKMSIALSGAFSIHATRFVQDDSGKWRVV
jgi:hypothetical protein